MFSRAALAANETLDNHDADEHHDRRQIKPCIAEANRRKCASKRAEHWFGNQMKEAVRRGEHAVWIDREPAQDDPNKDDQHIRVEQCADN